MKKIIHLTDLHTGYENCEQEFERIVNNIIYRMRPAEDYIIVITGDLVEDATRDPDYVNAKKYIDKLVQVYGKEKVLIIPGNHDYGTGNEAEIRFVKKFKKTFFGNDTIDYPKLDIVEDGDGDSIAFIGLDSMAKEFHWYDKFFADGELGKTQLNALEDLLSLNEDVRNCKKRVVYLHHRPIFYWWGIFGHFLKDRRKLKKAIKGKVDLLLNGHLHKAKNWNGKMKWCIPRIYNGGTSTKKDDWDSPHMVIDLSKDPDTDYDGNFYVVEKRVQKRKEKPYMARFRIRSGEALEMGSDDWDSVTLKNLSIGGAFFFHRKDLGIDTLLDFKIDVSKSTPINCVGRITRIDKPMDGIAIKFTDIEEQEKEMINKAVEEI